MFIGGVAPCHASKLAKKFFQEYKLMVFDCPSKSPDVNPIRNLKSILKKYVSKMDCYKKKMMIENVKVFYDKIKNLCFNLVESMSNCI